VAYWRGLRACEVGKLLLSDWKPEARRLYVHRAKGGLNGEYLVSISETKALQAWLKVRGDAPGPLFPVRGGRPPSRSHLHNLMRRYAEGAGLPPDKRHFHVLRHSIAVWLVDSGVDLVHIKDWLGHRSIASTMVYAALRNPTRDKIAEEVYKGNVL
jgi:type 1 fimbriae regulatory protein FimB